MKLVVADDDRDVVRTLVAILRDEGHEVHGVHRSEEVLPLVRRVKPDVVMLDIGMPGQSGYALAQDVRAAYYPAEEAPRLVAITRRASSLGFDHYLERPSDPAEVGRLLATLTSSRILMRPLAPAQAR